MLGHPIGRTYTPTEAQLWIARRVRSEDRESPDSEDRGNDIAGGQLVDGKYRVEHLLGEGGMAAVWAGTNERTGKRVALKVILRSLATTPAAQGLFHSEALASSRVNHPNVVTVFDVIEHEGMACIVMELLEGEPLGSYITARDSSASARRRSFCCRRCVGWPPLTRRRDPPRSQAAEHLRLHRARRADRDQQGVGFWHLGHGGTGDGSFAGPLAGLAMGTPAYMSPESLMGSASVDERADVYGFGVLRTRH